MIYHVTSNDYQIELMLPLNIACYSIRLIEGDLKQRHCDTVVWRSRLTGQGDHLFLRRVQRWSINGCDAVGMEAAKAHAI